MNCSLSYSRDVQLTTAVKDASEYWNYYGKISASTIPIICLTFITSGLKMKRPKYIRYKKENGLFVISNNIAGHVLYVAEKTYSDMVEELRQEFFEAWCYYALENDDNLSEGAKKVKNWLLDNIQEV